MNDDEIKINEENRIKFINEINRKFCMKNLTNGIEINLWDNLFAEEDEYGKALMLARRSPKCMSFINNYIGRDYENKIMMNDQDFNLILRLLFNEPINNISLPM